MALPVSTLNIDPKIFELINDVQETLIYPSMNEVVKMLLAIASNPEFISDEELNQARQQLDVYEHIGKYLKKEPKVILHIRMNPALKDYADSLHLLASIEYMGLVSTDPTNVFKLSEKQLNRLMQPQKI